MNFYSNLPNISISQFDGEINLYDVNKNSDIYLKKMMVRIFLIF